MVRRRSARLAKAAPKSATVASQLGSLREEDGPKTLPTASTKTTNAPDVEPASSDPIVVVGSAKPTPPALKKPSTTTTITVTTLKDLPPLPPTPRHEPSSLNPPQPSTPLNSSAIKPPRSEMHPSKIPNSTQSGLHLGFADLRPATLDVARTPSKITALGPLPTQLALPPGAAAMGPPSSPFTFRLSARPEELRVDGEAGGQDGGNGHGGGGLSGDAFRMMAELRGEAAKIRAELAAKKQEDEGKAAAAPQSERKIAKPRGRFSAAHQALFDKMKSIENHPSAWRINRSPAKAEAVDGAGSTLKRSPSKAAAIEAPSTGLKRARFTKVDDDKVAPASIAAPSSTTAPATALTATTTTPSLKRTLSKASLADKPTSIPSATAQRTLKRTLSKANLDDAKESSSGAAKGTSASPTKAHSTTTTTTASRIPAPGTVTSPIKRLKAHFEDDASTNRPAAARDNGGAATTAIPQPKSFGASMRGLIGGGGGSTPGRSIARPSQARTGSMTPNPLRKPAVPAAAGSQTDRVYKIATPSRFSQIRATIQARLAEARALGARDSVPTPATTAQTPSQAPVTPSAATPTASSDNDKPLPALPSVPTTTPSRTLFKRVQFTPKTAEAVLSAQGSPTPLKVQSKIPAKTPTGARTVQVQVTYPDLSKYEETLLPTPKMKHGAEETTETAKEADKEQQPSAPPTVVRKELPTTTPKGILRHHHVAPSTTAREQSSETPKGGHKDQRLQTPKTAPAVPGTFTFRSDHTIKFQSPSDAGFGATKGQSSVRQVRPSVLPSIPGAFPAEVSSDKENNDAATPPRVEVTAPENGIPHGLQGKKRARATWEEEEAQVEEEAARRAAKRQRAEHPAGAELFSGPPGPRARMGPSMTSSPVRPPPKTPNQPIPAKKRPFLSISRLNALAQPKHRR